MSRSSYERYVVWYSLYDIQLKGTCAFISGGGSRHRFDGFELYLLAWTELGGAISPDVYDWTHYSLNGMGGS